MSDLMGVACSSKEYVLLMTASGSLWNTWAEVTCTCLLHLLDIANVLGSRLETPMYLGQSSGPRVKCRSGAKPPGRIGQSSLQSVFANGHPFMCAY
jgi:hypothetical protein